MKSNDFLSEDIASDAHDMHLDHEVQMARKDCYAAADDAIALHKLLRNISEQQGLEGWVAAKITLASDYLNTVREHLEYQLMSQVPAATMVLPVAESVIESKRLHKKVRIVKGPDAGKTGYIRQIEHGQYKGAPKKYDVDIEGGGQANGLPATALRLIKDEQGVAEGSSTTWEVSFDYGPHMSETVKVKAGSEEEAIAKVEKAAEKRGRNIMINWAKPAEQGVAEGSEQEYKIYFTFPGYANDEEATIVIANSSEEAAQKFKDETPEAKIKDIIPLRQDGFGKEQGVAEGSSTTWEVSFDYGPHMSETVKVKAGSEEEAIAKVEKAAEKRGRNIMINWAKPAEQGVAEGSGPEKKMTVDQALEIAKKNNSSFTAKDYYDLIIRNEGLASSFFNSEVMSAIQKKQGVAEMKDGRPYSDPYRRHPGNSSYMTPEYLIQKYKERLAQIEAGPHKYTKEVAQLQSRIAKLEKKRGVAEGYWKDALKKAEADREARKGKPFKKNPASHDKDGVYKGDKDLAGNPVPKRKEQGVAEGSEQSLQKKIQAKRDALGLAREQRRMRGQHQQGPREIKLQTEIDRLNTELTQLKKQGVAEDASGGGSGSVATVVNPGGKPKSQVGSLFGGTFQRKKKTTSK